MIKGLIFDFDGLILDTEGPVFQSWAELFQEFGFSLSLDYWSNIIGRAENALDPLDELERLLGRLLDRDPLSARRRQRENELVSQQALMPGVLDYLQDARRLGLKTGLASSSSCGWVVGHLQRLGLASFFEVVRARDDVMHTKPDPELYLSALAGLGISPDQAFALEDSPHGVDAARQAGLFCVAVPNPITRQLPLDHADLLLDSLAGMPLEQLVKEIERRINGVSS